MVSGRGKKRLSLQSATNDDDNDSHRSIDSLTQQLHSQQLVPVVTGRKRKKTSWVWNHFLRGDNERNVCRHCLELHGAADATSYPSTTGNSTLAIHLHTKHGIVKDGYATPAPAVKVADAAAVASSGARMTPSAIITTTPVGASDAETAAAVNERAVAPKLQKNESPKSAGQYAKAVDEHRKAEIEESLLNFLVEENLDFDILETPSFITLCEKLNPSFLVPSRNAFLGAIENQFDQALQKFFLIVQRIPGCVALTADRWSSPGYVGLTLHWISSEWELKNCLLEFKFSPPPYDPWSITELILSALKQYNLCTKMRAITTDNEFELLGPAVTQVRQIVQDEYMMHISNHWHLCCGAHIVKQCAIAAAAKVNTQLVNLRAIIKTLHDSVSLQNLFKTLQLESGETNLKPIPPLDVENAWDGLFNMIDSAFEVRDVLDALCNNDDFSSRLQNHKLSDLDWRTLKAIKEFLQRAVSFTAVSDDDWISASLLPLIYDSLQAHCKKTIEGRPGNPIPPLVKAAASAFLERLQKNKHHMWNDYANLAQILDPRISNASAEALAMKEEIRQTLIDQYGMNVQEYEYSPTGGVTATPEKQHISSLFAAARQARNESLERIREDEVDAFYKFTAKPDLSCDDVLEWWKVVGVQRFPKLSLLARDTLMIMGSALTSNYFTGSDQLVGVERAMVNDKDLEIATKVRAWNQFA
ncbi:hypothetical protein FI667_g354, partial [Globisporangium splendens]